MHYSDGEVLRSFSYRQGCHSNYLATFMRSVVTVRNRSGRGPEWQVISGWIKGAWAVEVIRGIVGVQDRGCLPPGRGIFQDL